MAEAANKAVPEAEELPKTIVRRVVKDKLSRCSEDGDITVNKDALLAFSESARIFIHYLSATANDICKESKRQIISADDILKAIEETEFSEFIGPMKASLEEFRKKNAGKRAAVSKGKENESNKKRRVERDSSEKGEFAEKGNGCESSEKFDGSEPSDKANGSASSDKANGSASSDMANGDASSDMANGGASSDKGEGSESSDKGEGSESSDKGEDDDSE